MASKKKSGYYAVGPVEYMGPYDGEDEAYEAYLKKHDTEPNHVLLGKDTGKGIDGEVVWERDDEPEENPSKKLPPKNRKGRLIDGIDPLHEEHPDFPRSDWKYEVMNDDTVAGYADWLATQIEIRDDLRKL
jgi:hypothetical protein